MLASSVPPLFTPHLHKRHAQFPQATPTYPVIWGTQEGEGRRGRGKEVRISDSLSRGAILLLASAICAPCALTGEPFLSSCAFQIRDVPTGRLHTGTSSHFNLTLRNKQSHFQLFSYQVLRVKEPLPPPGEIGVTPVRWE